MGVVNRGSVASGKHKIKKKKQERELVQVKPIQVC